MPKLKSTKLPSAAEVWLEAQDLAEDLVEAGSDESKTIESIADFLDAILPLDRLVPGELGRVAENFDGPLFEKILYALRERFRVDPEKRAERKAKRESRKAERRARRAQRKAERKAQPWFAGYMWSFEVLISKIIYEYLQSRDAISVKPSHHY